MKAKEDLSSIWVNPFNGYIDITEREFIFSLKPIFLIGPRGCGKTTLFKRLSDRIVIEGDKLYYGAYVDLGKFKNCSIEDLTNTIKEIIVFRRIELRNTILSFKEKFCEFNNYQELYFSKMLDVTMYYEKEYTDLNEFTFYEKINDELSNNFKYVFVLYLDDYDLADRKIQSYINTIIKYIGEDSITTYRISKRVRELKLSETISSSEFLKYGSDYKEACFNFLKANQYSKEFYYQLANQLIEKCGIQANVKTLLGSKENFENEANEIIRNRKWHFDKFGISDPEEIDLLSFPNKPLIEMMNIILTKRLMKNRKIHFDIDVSRSEIQNINSISKQYQEKIKNENTKKYHNDYANKYRLSLLFILCDIYKERKSFYSFNTLMYVCSGDLNYFKNFINRICALVKLNNINEFPVDMKHQDVIFAEISKEYCDKVQLERNEVYTLINNVGVLLRKYHIDYDIKYPETTQCFIGFNLGEEERIVFDGAYYESDFIKKSRIQNKSIGMGKGSLYVLNKVYAPHYQISYRIRGGYNISLTNEMFTENFSKNHQLSIFEDLGVEE